MRAQNPDHLLANLEAESICLKEEDLASMDEWDIGVKGSLCRFCHVHNSARAKSVSSALDDELSSIRHGVFISCSSSCFASCRLL